MTSTQSHKFSEKAPSQSSISRNETPAMDEMQSPARRPSWPGRCSISSTTMPNHVGSASMPAPNSTSTLKLRVLGTSCSLALDGSKAKPAFSAAAAAAFSVAGAAVAGASSPLFLALRASRRFLLSSASSGVCACAAARPFRADSARARSFPDDAPRRRASARAAVNRSASLLLSASASSSMAAFLAAAPEAARATSSLNVCTAASSSASPSPSPAAPSPPKATSAAPKSPFATAACTFVRASPRRCSRRRPSSPEGSSRKRAAAWNAGASSRSLIFFNSSCFCFFGALCEASMSRASSEFVSSTTLQASMYSESSSINWGASFFWAAAGCLPGVVPSCSLHAANSLACCPIRSSNSRMRAFASSSSATACCVLPLVASCASDASLSFPFTTASNSRMLAWPLASATDASCCFFNWSSNSAR
mmetsp:Transcript_16842/g.58768  ORF Transcript_16842/g.58768 Transcript_16842/m.58768 type:complete len:422 (+) Transcript_16842:283-1548(+)